MGYQRWQIRAALGVTALAVSVLPVGSGVAAQDGGARARVELELTLEPELARQGLDLREVRLDVGRTRTLSAREMETLEAGGSVVPYVGVLPGLTEGVRVEVDAALGGESFTLRQGVRLLLREGERVRVGLVVARTSRDLVLRPELRSWEAATLTLPTLNPASAEALRAQADAGGRLAVATREFLAGRYLFAASRAGEVLGRTGDGAALSAADRRSAIYLLAASTLRTGDVATFQGLADRRQALEGSTLGDLLAVETALAALSWEEMEPAAEAAAGRLSSARGPLGRLASLLRAALHTDAPPAERARLYRHAAGLGGQLGAVAAWEAARSWRMAGRPDSAAAAFGEAAAAADSAGAPVLLAMMARLGEAEALVVGGRPDEALGALDGVDFVEERLRRLVVERREGVALLRLLDRVAELEIEIGGTGEGNERQASLLATELAALREAYRELTSAGGEERLRLDFLAEAGNLASYKVRARALHALGRAGEAEDALVSGLALAVEPEEQAAFQILRAHQRMADGAFVEALDVLASARRDLEAAGVDGRRIVRAVSRWPALSGDDVGPASGVGRGPTADLGPLVRALLDSLAAEHLPSTGATLPGDAPPSARWAWTPGPEVREGVWALADVELRTLQAEVLAAARAAAAGRSLARLGSTPSTDAGARLDERIRRRLADLAGPGAVEGYAQLNERIAGLDGAVAIARELDGVEVAGVSLPEDAHVVTTREGDAVAAQLAARRRQLKLLRALEEAVALEDRLAEAWHADDGGAGARDIAVRARRLASALEAPAPTVVGPGAGVRVTGVEAPEEALRRFLRAEASLVAASGEEVLATVDRLHTVEADFRAGGITREEAVAVVAAELEAALENLEEALRILGERRLAIRQRASTASPPLHLALGGEPAAASAGEVLELVRFGEAGAAFAAAMAGDHPVEAAVAVHEAFLERHPRSRWRARAHLQLAELHVRAAETRFAGGMRSGSADGADALDEADAVDRADSPAEADAPDYTVALSTLERALPELEGEERRSALISLGALYFQVGRWEEAARSFRAWVEGESDEAARAEGRFRWADALFAGALERSGSERNDLLDEAAALYGEAAESTPDPEVRILALYKLGWARYMQNRYADARDAFGRLLDLHEATAGQSGALDLRDEVTRYAAIALSQMEEPGRELNLFAALRPEDFNFPTYHTLAETLMGQGRSSEAVAVLRDYQGLRALEERALEAQQLGLEMLETEGLVERSQAARIELVDRYGPGSRWWEVNPRHQDTARVLTEQALRRAAHDRMARADDDARAYEEAAELYLRYAELFPRSDSARAMRYLGAEALFEAGDLIAAGDAYLTAAFRHAGGEDDRRQSALNAVAAYQAGLAAAETEAEADRAARRLYRAAERLTEAFPEHEDARLALRAWGETAFERGDGAEAFAALTRYVGSFPDDPFAPSAQKLLGDLAYREGNRERAIGLWRGAERAADSADADGLAGELLAMRSSVTLALADSLAETERAREAVELYLTFGRERPDDPRAPLALVNAADLLVELEDRAAAIEVLDELARAHPDHERAVEAAVLRAELLTELGRHEEAIEAYGTLADGQDGGIAADALLRRAELQVDAGRPVEAADSYLRFARSHPDDERAADALRTAARMFEEEERTGRAEEVYEEFLRRFPSSRDALDVAARLVRSRESVVAEGRLGADGPALDEAYERLLAVADGASGEEAEPHRELIGAAHLRRARRSWDEYADIRFEPSALTEEALLSERARKDRAMEAVVQHLDRALETGAPAAVSEALWLLGRADVLYAEYIRDVRLPEGTPPPVVEVVRERTAELAEPYRARAGERWSRLVELAADRPEDMDLDPDEPGLQNEWLRLAKAELEGGVDGA